ncbi:MAG: hypothetical protein WCT10_05010 [Patescibacteria group bacterium]|jgi:hypothetical protein
MTSGISPKAQAFEFLAASGGLLAEKDLLRRLCPRIQAQYRAWYQTRTACAKRAIEELIGSDCVARGPDDWLSIVGPLTVPLFGGGRVFELSLHPSGRGLRIRRC